MVCSGPCNQRVKRGAFFFITRDGARLWCQKCHTGLSSVLPPTCGSSGDPDLDVTDPDFSPQARQKKRVFLMYFVYLRIKIFVFY